MESVYVLYTHSDDEGHHFLDVDDYTRFVVGYQELPGGLCVGVETYKLDFSDSGIVAVTAITSPTVTERGTVIGTKSSFDLFGDDDEPPGESGVTANLDPKWPPISDAAALEPPEPEAFF